MPCILKMTSVTAVYGTVFSVCPPLGTPYDEDGNLVDYPLGDGNMNPLADMGEDQYVNNVKTLSVAPQIYVELTPLKGLSFKSLLGGYFRNVKESKYTGTKIISGD